MKLKGKRIAFVITGSFCTFANMFKSLEELVNEGAEVQPIFSVASQKTDSRFGDASDFIRRAESITGNAPWFTIPQVEPIGPKKLFDLLVILPCTGNTIAKLSNGIVDDPALMAAKAHLRNGRPLVISVSTNDALGMNMKNIGLLLNSKHIYFVPFKQDDPVQKPNSLVAVNRLLIPALEEALEERQYQPILADLGKAD